MKHQNIPVWDTVELDLHSLCNRNCYFCPRYNDRSGIRKDASGKAVNRKMPTEKVYSILDELGNLGYSGRITFHRLSEPLLDKRYLDFVKYAKSKGMEVEDHTNGDVLMKNEILCKQLDGLVDTFVIGLYDYKSESEREGLKRFWLGRFKKTNIRFSTPIEGPDIRQKSGIYSDAEKNEKILDLPCTRRLSGLLIRYDGGVQLCCEDDACDFNLGNAFEQSIEEIWWSDRHVQIVNDLQKPGSRHNYELCSKCFKGYNNGEEPTFGRKLKSVVKKTRSKLMKLGF